MVAVGGNCLLTSILALTGLGVTSISLGLLALTLVLVLAMGALLTVVLRRH